MPTSTSSSPPSTAYLPAVADQLFILANGAMVAAATLDWPEAAGEARAAAATILDAHIV